LKFFEDRVEGFSGEAFDLQWDFGGFLGFDCSWTGLEWKIDESFRWLGVFPVGGLKLNSKSVAKWESCDRPKTILDGKLPEQLEMKMRSSWSPKKNFHHFFLLSVREVLAVDNNIFNNI
jgi:hypothetical protein